MTTLNEGSKRLDKTLSSDAFAYKDSVALLVKNHLIKFTTAEDGPKEKHHHVKQADEGAQYWFGKIWTFLDDLRSASAKVTGKLKPTDETSSHSREWKLKDDGELYRVMYREGPHGTPFHTLCLDGVVDGDFASALCVAWESPMYKEWWPQFFMPTFKIVESKYLRRIRVGHDLSVLRFKVPWPMAGREVVMSAFGIAHFQEDLIIGLVESIPETEEIKENIHGFSASDLPSPGSNVRMAVRGGFVMQRASKDKFFFRTILSLDMKLDLVPPWLINFMSRQVAGQGLKLYQKAVIAATNGTGSGKAFQKPLRTSAMYEKIRLGFEAKAAATGEMKEKSTPPLKDSAKAKTSLQESIRRMGSSEHNKVAPYPVKPDVTKETKESAVQSENLATDQTKSQRPPERHQDKAAEKFKLKNGSTEEIKSGVASSSESVHQNNSDVASSSKSVHENNSDVASSSKSVHAPESQEYHDSEVLWAVNVLDKVISYTRSVAGQAPAPGPQESQKETTTLSIKEKVVDGKFQNPPTPHGNAPSSDVTTTVMVNSGPPSDTNQKSDKVDPGKSRPHKSTNRDTKSGSDSPAIQTSDGTEASRSRQIKSSTVRHDDTKSSPTTTGNAVEKSDNIGLNGIPQMKTSTVDAKSSPALSAKQKSDYLGDIRCMCVNLGTGEAKLVPLPNGIQKVENLGVRTSPYIHIAAGADDESPGNSGFWSASEIEVLTSQDDTDTDIGASSTVTSVQQANIEGSDVEVEMAVQSKRRRRRWRWTCFTPNWSRKPGVPKRMNMYAHNSGRKSEGQLTALLGKSFRHTKGRGYVTDEDQVYDSMHTPEKSVTMSQVLSNNER